jgi:hypothetical protein
VKDRVQPDLISDAGLWAHYTEYPEEGGLYLGPADPLEDYEPPASQPAAEQSAGPTGVRDLRMAKWLDPQCADRGACQSLLFKEEEERLRQANARLLAALEATRLSLVRKCEESRVSFNGEDVDALKLASDAIAAKPARCPLCKYQHGHAIGCDNNPVDIALKASIGARAGDTSGQ